MSLGSRHTLVKTPTEIEFHFKVDGDYRVIPVNCVWGGSTSRGDIMVHLCHEAPSIPESVRQEVTPEGIIGKELGRTQPHPVLRTAFAGMVLSPDQAESIGLWLQEHARELRQRMGRTTSNDSERNTQTAD